MKILAYSLLLPCLLWSPVSAELVSWGTLVDRMADPGRMARLDEEPARLLASTDPSGGNDDFGHNVKPGPDGWWIIADLEGPGYVSRFWFTGGHPDGTHGLRLYFDGETAPRFDSTVGAFCGGEAPFESPLAAYENFCWTHLAPIPYRKRLVIMVQAPHGIASKIYFQVNARSMPDGQSVESAQYPVPPAMAEQLHAVAEQWREGRYLETSAPPPESISLSATPGTTAWTDPFQGPAIGRSLRIEPDWSQLGSPAEQADALRQVRLVVRYNDMEQPSIDVPLGDFFGSMWQPVRYQSMYFGLEGDTFVSRFPMPFAGTVRIGLANDGARPFPAAVVLQVEGPPAELENLGYLHAAWTRSGPEHVGRPHMILRAQGQGRYAGCLLSVTSADRSWWILEGDESIRIDGEATPSWLGTGLEDYFNGGWYYQNAMARPLHGLPFKAPFRTIQYRLHQPDPVVFKQGIEVAMERGPGQGSHGWMESTAWYYLAQPAPSASMPWKNADRSIPSDGMAQATIQHELNNFERLGDVAGAAAHLAVFRQRHPGLPYDSLLALRGLAYRERLEGFAAARPAYEAFLAAETNGFVRRQAEDLLWVQEDPQHALLGVYSNGPVEVRVSGRKVAEVQDPTRLRVFRLKLPPGRHTLALVTAYQPYPSWTQVCLRTRDREVVSTPDWKVAFAAGEGWDRPGFDDRSWRATDGTGVKGPPEVPHVYLEPHAYVGMQSAAIGIRPPEDKWVDKRRPCLIRHDFTLAPSAEEPM